MESNAAVMLQFKDLAVKNYLFDQCIVFLFKYLEKGHTPSADLRYGEEDSISPNTLVLAAIKG